VSTLHVTRWSARLGARTLPCAIGRGGIGVKKGEGDGITPNTPMRLVRWLYRGDRLGGINGDVIGPRDIWSDDPRDPAYNQQTRVTTNGYSHERLMRADPLYDLIGVLDFNLTNPKPGAGSAIFLHVWRKPRHPTEGCIAFDLRDLLWLHEHLPLGSLIKAQA